MRKALLVLTVFTSLVAVVSPAPAAVPVANQFRVTAQVSTLSAGKVYRFTFRLYDAARAGTLLFSEVKSYTVPASKTISHLLGSVNLTQPLRAEDFLQQVWVEVSAGAKVWPRFKLGPVPLAIGSQNADRLDGLEATDLALAAHTHGGAGSGLDADLLDGHDGSFYRDAGNLTGSLSDGRLSDNVDLLAADQTVTGIKTFDPPTGAGTPPFAVAAAKSGLVGNLNADLLDGRHGVSYRDAGNLDAGTLGTDRYSAAADLAAEGLLGDGAGDIARNNGLLQATLYAQRAQTADSADALGAAAQAVLDARHGLAAPSIGLTAYATRESVGALGIFPSITIGADALPVIFYYSLGQLRALHCGDAACVAGNTTATVDATGDAGYHTSATIGTDGLPVVSYYDVGNRNLKVLHCGDAACTAGNQVTLADGSDGEVGEYTSITIGADGLPLVSYYDRTNQDLKVFHCSNAACTAGTATAVDETGNVGWATSATVGADGRPVISYVDGGTYDLKVLHCGDAACSAGNTVTTVDSGAVGWFTSITIGADALPVIAYHSFGTNDLKVLHCGNAACSAGNVATTVESGGVGFATSIAIGSDGLPVISHHDTTNRLLKLVHCGNAACSAGTTTAAVGATGGATPYSTITVGADGLPVISYYDHTAQELQAVRVFYKPLGRR